MNTDKSYSTVKVAFSLLIAAAAIQFFIDSQVLLDFMLYLIPENLNYDLTYLLIALLYVTAVILLNNHFSNRTSILVNSVVVAGALPYTLFAMADILAIEGLPVTRTAYMITEPLLYLVVFIGFIYYCLSGNKNLRALLTASFGILFLTIAAFHFVLFKSFETPELAEYLDYILGLGIIISSIGIVGCSIYFLSDLKKVVDDKLDRGGSAPVTAGNKVSRNQTAGEGKDESSNKCANCDLPLEGNERFCPGCGFRQDSL